MANMDVATGAQYEHTIKVETPTDSFLMIGRPCELSAHAFVPTSRGTCPKERNAFNSKKEDRYSHSTYDRLFHQQLDYNNKLHRCDRDHAKSKGLTVNSEERIKIVPTLGSSIYGHKLKEDLEHDLDPPTRKHVRVALVQTEFYRRNNINVKETPDQNL